MTVKFSELLEGSELSEDVRATLQETWDSTLAEAKENQSAELREEFAQRYEHDKGVITEAVDNFITDKVNAEISELAEDRKELSVEKVRYRKAVEENVKVLENFVLEVVSKEVQELRKDRGKFNEHVNKLDEFVGEQLAEELSEFHSDKKALVEQRVKMVKAGKKELKEAKKKFIAYASEKVEGAINSTLTKEMASLREDITLARENDFGRKIFEAFVSEYGSSIMNESKEIHKVQKALTKTQAALSESRKDVADKETQVQKTQSQIRVMEDKQVRSKKLTKLLENLGTNKRKLMKELLEKTQTKNLDRDFNKYLGGVLSEETSRKKKTITEGAPTKQRTGNKRVPAQAETIDTDVVDLDEMRKLAGMTKT